MANKLLIDAGSVALSKDVGAPDVHAEPGFGLLYEARSGERLAHLRLTSLSQEHGQIFGVQPADFARLPVGTVLRIAANHSCLAAAQHPIYNVADGGRFIALWHPTRGW